MIDLSILRRLFMNKLLDFTNHLNAMMDDESDLH